MVCPADFINGLSEWTLFEHSVTVPSNAVLPDGLREECNCYYIKPELFELGMVRKKTTFGKSVLSLMMHSFALYSEQSSSVNVSGI